MRKVTFETIYNTLTAFGYDNAEVMDELRNELNKGAELKAQNAAMYEAVKPIVMEELGDSTCTIGELWEAVADKMPEGFTKGKLQYAVTRLWLGSDLERVEGKVNGYRKV